MFKIKLKFKKDSFLPDFARHTDSKIINNILIIRKETVEIMSERTIVQFWFYKFVKSKWKYITKLIQGSDELSFEESLEQLRKIKKYTDYGKDEEI